MGIPLCLLRQFPPLCLDRDLLRLVALAFLHSGGLMTSMTLSDKMCRQVLCGKMGVPTVGRQQTVWEVCNLCQQVSHRAADTLRATCCPSVIYHNIMLHVTQQAADTSGSRYQPFSSTWLWHGSRRGTRQREL